MSIHTPPHTPTRPHPPSYPLSPPQPPPPPRPQLQLMTPKRATTKSYIPTPAASRPSSPIPSLTIDTEKPRRSSTSISRTPSSLSLPLPLPLQHTSLGLTKRHRRLTALLLTSLFLLLALAYSLFHLSSTGRLLPIDVLLSHPSSPPTTPSTYNARPKPPPLPPLLLSPEEELAALVSHLASVLDTNSLPAEIDPSLPIDPDYLLGFDTRGPDRETVDAKVRDMVADTWATLPVVVFTKVPPLPPARSFVAHPLQAGPRSREVLSILSSYSLTPAPLEISLDSTRPDSPLLLRALARLTASSLPTSSTEGEVSLPLLLLGGKAVHRTVRNLHANGELRGMFREAGVGVGRNPLKDTKR
ncbi:hypothetical protein DACRYDRAFT_105166 [Dacryopinax primogenitus]|uniref:Uncharacterized protein n=1 Tax=Dacryopinax primogenitus (strain DJM 731) TaxID=1858805 RepID=M5GFF2_DACPD|nr:uncharacterized protein DACRYDRAFT_105166 [Dacryopinax primogenitus]EJU04098.1 hypothetical protein DACRYDRAFT_105166 [Dacryopinax primogenitus]